ncbi:hypothetical protein AB6A40_003734 [Gnathostoma spinigerum]|uniref:Uncharacterized protein n=1 Tax=Gnathostoma spinigerum TaxID=75299 RepID=A0ABD6EL77_9BILA
MGSRLSCGCESRPCLLSEHFSLKQPEVLTNGILNENRVITSVATTSSQLTSSYFRFWAEVFQLSADRSEWIILHPSLLTVIVGKSTQNPTNVTVTARSETAIILEQLLDQSSKLTRVSSSFAYWRFHGQTYGINVISSEDCDHLCRLMDTCCALNRTSVNPTEVTSNVSPQAITVRARISQILDVENGRIRHANTAFRKCIIFITPNSVTVNIDHRNFGINLLESVMVIGEVKHRLYVSEPSGAFAVECDDPKTLRSLLVHLLTVSAFLLAKTTIVSNAAHFIQKQINKTNGIIESLLRSLSNIQRHCGLARDLDEELEMSQLRLFTLKYRLAVLCDLAFPSPSVFF